MDCKYTPDEVIEKYVDALSREAAARPLLGTFRYGLKTRRGFRRQLLHYGRKYIDSEEPWFIFLETAVPRAFPDMMSIANEGNGRSISELPGLYGKHDAHHAIRVYILTSGGKNLQNAAGRETLGRYFDYLGQHGVGLNIRYMQWPLKELTDVIKPGRSLTEPVRRRFRRSTQRAHENLPELLPHDRTDAYYSVIAGKPNHTEKDLVMKMMTELDALDRFKEAIERQRRVITKRYSPG